VAAGAFQFDGDRAWLGGVRLRPEWPARLRQTEWHVTADAFDTSPRHEIASIRFRPIQTRQETASWTRARVPPRLLATAPCEGARRKRSVDVKRQPGLARGTW
jgi:hypothetical protein